MKKILKIIGKSIVAIFALLCVLIFVQSFVLDKILYPNNLYIERNEINDNKTLIGLSEEEVIELLGEPKFKSDERGVKSYTYSAGTTVKKSIFVGNYQRRSYDLHLTFDENNKVKSTVIQQIP